jgi:hypothetical protein
MLHVELVPALFGYPIKDGGGLNANKVQNFCDNLGQHTMRRFSKPRERWPKTKKALTYFVLLLLVLGLAARPLARGAVFYQSYWGGAVFVPILFVIATLVFVISFIDLRKK